MKDRFKYTMSFIHPRESFIFPLCACRISSGLPAALVKSRNKKHFIRFLFVYKLVIYFISKIDENLWKFK